ncbi:MAG: YccF domain-containing protein [Actinomycetaceae bacterium]|nr:YccF domain-containing protein [Actinomycetaceae bacterium]
MGVLLNIIWVLFGGFWLALEYAFLGVLGLIFIVTAPAGFAAFRIAGYVIWPFGRSVVQKPGAGTGSLIMNVVWFFIAGLWLAIGHLFTAAALAITIIGIPLAVANLKLIPITCFPFGKMIVNNRDAYRYVVLYQA